MSAVVGDEEEGAVDVGEVLGAARPAAGANVADHLGSRRGAIAPPQLVVLAPVAGGAEEEAAVDGCEPRGIAPSVAGRVDVLDKRRPRRGAIASPQLAAVDIVEGSEIEDAVDGGERIGLAAPGPRVEVLYQGGPCRGAIASPQLLLVEARIALEGGEVEDAVDGGEQTGPASPARVDVLDKRRPGGGAIASPQLAAVDAVGGGEVEDAVDGGERIGVAAPGPRVDLLYQRRPRRGAVASPQLVVGARAAVGAEEEIAVDGCERPGGASPVPGVRGRVDVLDQRRPRRGAVASPQLTGMDAVVGGEVEAPADGGELAGVASPHARDDVPDQRGTERRAGRGAVRRHRREYPSYGERRRERDQQEERVSCDRRDNLGRGATTPWSAIRPADVGEVVG